MLLIEKKIVNREKKTSTEVSIAAYVSRLLTRTIMKRNAVYWVYQQKRWNWKMCLMWENSRQER